MGSGLHRTGTSVLDEKFQVRHRFRPVQLVAEGFEAVSAGSCTGDGLTRLGSGPVAPFAAVELAVAASDGPISAGLATADDEHVLVTWDPALSRVAIVVRTAGRTRILRRRTVELPTSARFAFVLCENQVTALVDVGDGWQALLSERRKVAALVDLRDEATLARHEFAWGGNGVALDSLRAGVFGMVGLRDPHLVQHADGSPYERDGRRWLTWTCAGLGFFQQAHWSVWSMDPRSPADLRLEAHLFSRRDGLVLGDHAGQLVRDGDRWLVATSAWGDFTPGSIHVRHTESTADLLRGVHVLDTEPTPLPSSVGTWDPALTRIGDTWHVAYVESPSQRPFRFRSMLTSTRSDTWHAELAEATALGDLGQSEGPILVRDGHDTWVLTSDGLRHEFAVFDLTGARVGRLDAPYVSNIPHPQLVPDPAGGWWLVTFDGTAPASMRLGYGAHGDVVVMHTR